LVSDRGKKFLNKTLAAVNDYLKISHNSTTPYHPQANGLTENANRTIQEALSKMVSFKQADWDVFLPYVLFAMRTKVHASTLETP